MEGPVLLPRRQEEVPRLRRPLGGFARDDGIKCDSPTGEGIGNYIRLCPNMQAADRPTGYPPANRRLGGTMQRVATGFGLIEGPVWDASGLYFSDVINGGVHLLDRAGKVSLVVPKRRGSASMMCLLKLAKFSTVRM